LELKQIAEKFLEMKEKAADMGKKAHKEGHLHMHEISFHYLEGDKYTDAELKKQ